MDVFYLLKVYIVYCQYEKNVNTYVLLHELQKNL